MSKSKLVDEIGQFTAIPNEFIEASLGLSDRARWLFVLLRHYTNSRSGDAFPSYDELQKMTGWRRPDLATAVRELLKSGWVTRQRRYGASSVYRLVRPSSSPDGTNETVHSSSPVRTISSSPVRTVVVHPSELNLDRFIKIDSNQIDMSPKATHSPETPIPDTPETPASSLSKPEDPDPDRHISVQDDAPKTPPPSSAAPPSPATWDEIDAAPVAARQNKRAVGASKEAVERAIQDVCFGPDKDLRRANLGEVRRWAKDIREVNPDLTEPVTAETIYYVFEDSGFWQAYFMSLDETSHTRRRPTPGVVGKHTLNILAWAKEAGVTPKVAKELADQIEDARAHNERLKSALGGDAKDKPVISDESRAAIAAVRASLRTQPGGQYVAHL